MDAAAVTQQQRGAIRGWDADEVARIAWQAVRPRADEFEVVRFVLFGDRLLTAFERAGAETTL